MSSTDPIESRREAMSAFMDGDRQAAEVACRAWRDDTRSRADWHAYHLIGDLLRSDEHCSDAAHDATFVTQLRARLVREPAVPAPPSLAIAAGRRRAAWVVPTAVAAGFVAVAGALLVTRIAGSDSAADPKSLVASTPDASSARIATAVGASDSGLDNANMIRSAELDRYLAAHRQYADAAALAVPGGVVRSVAAVAPGR
jgi:sigma-E factor negative regulatory protein RseA